MSEELIQATKQSLKALDVQRQSLETEAQAITHELTEKPANGGEPMGIDTPLTDVDGYPRGDIDVYRARSLRGRLAEIRTDHKNLMKEIDRHLQQLARLQNGAKEEEAKTEYAARMQVKPKPRYDPVSGKWAVKNWDGTVAGIAGGEYRNFDDLESNESPLTQVPSPEEVQQQLLQQQLQQQREEELEPVTQTSNVPFARIDAVAAHSPAEEAGLLENDLMVQFGSINIDTPDAFTKVGKLVPEAAGDSQSIAITLLRGPNRDSVTVSLTPRPWSGRGLIGCHIVPYSE